MTFDLETVCNFFFTVIKVATPLIYGALAVCITRQAGLLNMATESMMLSGALCGVIASGYLQSLGLGILGGLLGGILVALIISYAAFVFKTDLWMTCIAINTALVGGTILVMYILTGQKTNTLGYINSLVMPKVDIPLIKDIPILGNILSGHNLFTYLAFVFLFVEWFLLYRTRLGLRLRATGQNPKAAESVGIAPRRMYFLAFALSGTFAAMGGMFMSMGYLQWFARDMMAGRGFISMSAANIANGNPVMAMLVAVLFGFSDAVANYAQMTSIPAEFAYMFPYAATIVLLIVITLVKRSQEKKRMRRRVLQAQQTAENGNVSIERE